MSVVYLLPASCTDTLPKNDNEGDFHLPTARELETTTRLKSCSEAFEFEVLPGNAAHAWTHGNYFVSLFKSIMTPLKHSPDPLRPLHETATKGLTAASGRLSSLHTNATLHSQMEGSSEAERSGARECDHLCAQTQDRETD